MKRLSLALVVVILMVSCAKVPFTGRKQVKLLPGSQMQAMSATSYNTFLKENKLSTNQEQTQMVKRVGAKLKTAIETYFKSHGKGRLIKDFNWEFNLVENPQVNAWCMPGGKVVFYTGIMPICQNEEGIAVVMGHEISHAIARHGNERMSQQMLVQLGGMGLSLALSEKPKQTQSIFMQAYGLGSQVGVILPFSRTHEQEADRMGMIIMALAGYNPEKAPEFWERMSKMTSGNRPPEFLSTHPSHESRVKALKANMPEAMKYYKKK